MRKTYLILSLLLLVSACFALQSYAAETTDDAGKKLFLANNCNMCHSIQAQSIMKKTGGVSTDKGPPDLSNVGSKHNADWIANYQLKKETLNGKPHIKPFTGKEEDLQVISKWLETLKTEPAKK